MPHAENLTHASDEELIRAIAASGAMPANDALHELYNRYAARVLGYLHTRCRSHADAEDVSQMVWIRVYRSAEKFQGGEFRRWLFTIARNQVIDGVRRRNVRNEVALVDGDGALAGELVDDDERLLAMRDCLAQIGGDFVAAVVQVKLEGVSVAQFACEQKISEAAVYTRVHRGTQQLGECVKSKLEELE